MKILRLKNNLTVVLSDGSILSVSDCTDEMYNDIFNHQDDDNYVRNLLTPNFENVKEEIEIKNNISSSSILTQEGSSVYIKSISELSVPEDLAVALFKAEKEQNEELVQSYLNFWTLCSLNPDSRARTNLFWFLNKYEMVITKSGMFVAYRNVDVKQQGSGVDEELVEFISEQYLRVKRLKKSPKKYFIGTDENEQLICKPNENSIQNLLGSVYDLYQQLSDDTSEKETIYTDHHTHSMEIRLGEMVYMDRDKCDARQEQTCSTGLHVAARTWLQQNYFGTTSLLVLVNPADVVAVPPKDSYGKMRTCAYYPVSVIKRDKDGNIIDDVVDNGFEDDFIDKLNYEGDVNNEEVKRYTLTIPNIPELNRKRIVNRLKDIKSTLQNRVVADGN